MKNPVRLARTTESAASSFSDEFAGTLLTRSSNAFFLCRDGVVFHANPAAVRLIKAADEGDIVGRNLISFIDRSYHDVLAMGFDVFAEEETGVPLRMTGLSGDAIEVHMYVSSFGSDGDVFHVVECLDTTETIRNAKAARLREQRFAGILRSVQEAVVTIDEAGAVLSVNPSFEAMFGRSAKDFVGQGIEAIIPSPIREAHGGYIERYLRTGESRIIGALNEVDAVRADGTVFPIELTVSAQADDAGDRSFTAVIRDVTARMERQREIEFQAYHDPLTHLPNRNLLEDRLGHAVDRARRVKDVMALMYVDLDKFKPINDTWGHDAGDAVLKTVAQRLTDRARASDTVARVGGDEFVILLERLSHRDDAGKVAASMIEALGEPVDLAEATCQIGASIGIAVFPDDASDATGLTRCADETMYRVKRAGRNRYMYHGDGE